MAASPQYRTAGARPYAKSYARGRWSARPSAIILAAFGALALALWYLTNNSSATSMLLLLAGISVITLSLMLYCLSPGRYLASEAADAISLANTLNVGRMLSALLVESKGIYVPGDEKEMPRVFIPASHAMVADIGALKPGSGALSATDNGVKGIVLMPPGYGLFRHAQSMGAALTPEGLEKGIKDIMENGLELATAVSVRREEGGITVSMRGLVDADMCAAVRREDPRICSQTGCPICSFIGCMIVSGTGRKARIGAVGVSDNTVTVTYELLRE